MIDLWLGDCLEILAGLEENSIDSVITDPPYGLGKQPDIFKVLKAWMNDESVDNGGGFMGKAWDSFVPGPHYLKAVYRVMKPGGIALVFGGTRTYDLTTLALRMAGFEIRDTITWLYGSGFLKSHNISKAIDKRAGKEKVVGTIPDRWTQKGTAFNFSTDRPQEECKVTIPATSEAELWDGWGTALKPAWEPIIVAMKPIEKTFAENALTYGCAGMWIDGCRIGVDTIDVPQVKTTDDMYHNYTGKGAEYTGEIKQHQGRFPANLILSHTPECKRVGTRKVKGDKRDGSITNTPARSWKNASTAGIARIGHADENGLEEIESWECSENCPVAMLDRQSGITKGSANARTNKGTGNNCYGEYATVETQQDIWGDKGGASRFFYCARASTKERNEGLEEKNIHPTVKPLELMRYLCRLTKTPTGGIVLDPFMGSGSTGVAARLEGRDFIGIELVPEYFEIAKARIESKKDKQLSLL